MPMRPTLFSLGTPRAFSGLRITNALGNPLEPFDTLIDRLTLEHIREADPLLWASLTPEKAEGNSMVLRRVFPAFLSGERIQVKRSIDLRPYASFEPGELGTVESVDHETGEVDIRMDAYHVGLHYRQNCAWLIPFGTDDILDAFAILREPRQLLVDGMAVA